jgi:Protein of unknown function (DUF1571)
VPHLDQRILDTAPSRRSFLAHSAATAGLLLVGHVRAAIPTNPLDEPLRVISRARTTYNAVRDYTCILTKRELIDGKLSPNTTMSMSVRTDPFSIRLKWLVPSELKGQEAIYVAGKHDGKINVRPPGLLAAVGFVLIAPTDPRVCKMSRHSITEAGIGGIIEQFGTGWEKEQRLNVTQVRVGTFDFDKRRCTRIETTHPTNPDKSFVHYRSVVYFDQATNLPIRVEGYAWPIDDKPPELVEVYSFVNLKTNVGLPDSFFSR